MRCYPGDRRFTGKGHAALAGMVATGGTVSRYTAPSAWFENYMTRRRLLNCQKLDSRFAKDVGLTPARIAAEGSKPFWAAVELSREQ